MMFGNNRPHTITILGSTGSIGTNTLDVISQFGGTSNFEIVALTGANNVELLAKQAIEYSAKLAVTANEDHYADLKAALSGTGIQVAAGITGLEEAASLDAEWVMAAIAGTAGLSPTLTAAKRGATIALANKECLVSAGDVFTQTIKENSGKLIPVDSEHSAIFQCLETHNKENVERVIITASGGPFRTWSRDQMADVNVEMARAHPNWSMGLKVSIGSATMFNKALEIIEAKHLFNLQPEQIEVIVHPQSIIHSMVAYDDGSILAQLGCPDMRTAISYALTHPSRGKINVERLDFAKISRLDFEAPDENKFPALRIARRVLERGGLLGAVFNAADETAFNAFVDNKIGFLQMADVVEQVVDRLDNGKAAETIEDVFMADAIARDLANEIIEQNKSR